MNTWVALLRGINVGGHRPLPMADLASLVADLGWRDAQTYLQSGNLVFRADEDGAIAPDAPAAVRHALDQIDQRLTVGAALAAALEAAVRERFGFDAPVMVRSGEQWRQLAEGNPFPRASRKEPGHVLVAVAPLPLDDPDDDADVEAMRRAIAEAGGAGERVKWGGGALWIHYPEGSGTSKITPRVLDRTHGHPVTTRNWTTVAEVAQLVKAIADGAT